MKITTKNVKQLINKNVFITGETGSGKTSIARELIRSLEDMYSQDKFKYVLFDPKHVEFTVKGKDYKFEYLKFGVVTDPMLGLARLEYLSRISDVRVKEKQNSPQLLCYIDECDLAVLDQERFDVALINILNNSKATNMQVVYATSRPSAECISKKLLSQFDLFLVGKTSTSLTQLGIEKHEDLNPFEFETINAK